MKTLKLSNIGQFFLRLKQKLLKPAVKVSVIDAVDPFLNDVGKSYIRVHGTLIKSLNNPKGLFKRDELITLYNPETNLFVSGYARGCGSKYVKEKNFSKESVTLEYDQRQMLGISHSRRSVNLKMWSSRGFEVNYFMGFQNDDLTSRVIFLLSRRERD